MTNKIFAYGTLKRGFYNHKRFNLQEKSKFIKEAMAVGYRMYDLGPYPMVINTGNVEDVVYGEILEITDMETLSRISAIESSAGYSTEILSDLGEEVIIFAYEPGIHIKSGNWTKK